MIVSSKENAFEHRISDSWQSEEKVQICAFFSTQKKRMSDAQNDTFRLRCRFPFFYNFFTKIFNLWQMPKFRKKTLPMNKVLHLQFLELLDWMQLKQWNKKKTIRKFIISKSFLCCFEKHFFLRVKRECQKEQSFSAFANEFYCSQKKKFRKVFSFLVCRKMKEDCSILC